ncbi:MAG TPA: phosphopantothenoylcysteine decarboxylase [bacterium]|nr:phosphopantothenoylcysteine decarboxylase [bacterium]
MARSILRGKNVLVTAGSTRAPIDAVRFISNRSSGRLATEIAYELLRRGATVTFLHGIGSETPQEHATPIQKRHLNTVAVESFDELHHSVPTLMNATRFDCVIHAMAVLDYLPTEKIPGKIKSGRRELILKLAPAPKILPLFRMYAPNAFLVGFKLEVDVSTEELCQRAHKLIEQAGADMVVANLMPSEKPDLHTAYLVHPNVAHSVNVPEEIVGKKQIAWTVVEEVTKAIT